jgi:UDP-N-acetyl-D-glucosamine/UDP-N-acetyl-D-galactosamine dehydrogenase
VMGFTFKENVPDTRNTKVADLVRALQDFVSEVVIFDPMADADLAKHEYGLFLQSELPQGPFDAIILAVKHDAVAQLGEAGIKALLAPGGLIYDLKWVLPSTVSHARI